MATSDSLASDKMENQTMQPDFKNYKYRKQKKSRWWIPLAIVAGIILLLFVIVAGIGVFFDSLFSSKPMEVKSNSVLYLNVNYDIQEYTTLGPLELFSSTKVPSFFEIINSIKKAKTDDRIKGIYIKSGNATLGYAKICELNEAVEDFKKSGKFVYAYFETGDEKDYMVTLPAQKIFMPLEGMVQLDGLAAQNMFLKGFLDKIGVNFYVCGFEDFKTAAEAYSSTKFSDSSRYQVKEYIGQMFGIFLDAIQHYRSIKRSKAEEIINEGIFTTDGMLSNGFIDGVAIESNIKKEMSKLAWGSEYKNKKPVRLVKISDYAYSDPIKNSGESKVDEERQIAIVYASGSISHTEQTELFSKQSAVYANQFVSNLHKAVEDPKIKAIIIRIDSPGGSVLGSEIIWQEIRDAKRKKPIYASMSDVAASGGYYIAMACDTVIAHPATITGSIGVISAIPNFSGTLSKLGITIDTISTSKNALFMNPTLQVPQEQKDRFRAMSRDIYFRFVSRVAESRKMTFNEARALAKGRVWTGTDAKKNRLVDCLGDLRFAIKLAKDRIGLKDNQKVIFNVYPKPDADFNRLLKLLNAGNQDETEESLNMSNLNAMSIKLGQDMNFLSAIYGALPAEYQKQFIYNLNMINMALNEKIIMYAPFAFDIR